MCLCSLQTHVLTRVAESELLCRVGLPIKRQLSMTNVFGHASSIALGNVGVLVSFPLWSRLKQISVTIGWIAMSISTEVHGPQMMYPNDHCEIHN